ncbi:hypothetical protein ACGFX4_31970 [Kitasatospora sp. NPDC048365]|uniref:hypothetical protein n=1 Tax=Kitasatospora sp. NPDC048365 TaxID=3364050 RepID=UPI00371C16BE
MIVVTSPTSAAPALLGADGSCVRIRPLVPRGVLHSPAEGFEHLRLSPGAEHPHRPAAGAESTWYVLRGPVLAEQLPDGNQHLADAGDLLLVARGGGLRLQAGPLGAELLGLSTATPATSGTAKSGTAKARSAERARARGRRAARP